MVANTTRHLTATAIISAAGAAAVAIIYSVAIQVWSPLSPPPPWLSKFLATTTKTSRSPAACPELIDVSSLRGDVGGGDGQGLLSELLLNEGDHALDACQLFSDSYVQARDRFRNAARQVPGATIVSLPVYYDALTSDNGDGDDKDSKATPTTTTYTMDLVILPGSTETGNDPRLVVHTSGVHGVEGYAGSAVQLALLSLLVNYPRGWGGGWGTNGHGVRPTVVLVHSFNPYGMAHFRRCNENNVDLNRNGIRDFESLTGSQGNPRDAYEKFRNLFVPAVSPYAPWGWLWLRQWLVFAWAACRNGVPAIKEAMVNGQYHDASGIFYGGNRIQSSYTVLEKWIVEGLLPSLTSHSTITKSTSTDTTNLSVTWIDVHTGLGPSGEDTILPCLPKTSSFDASALLSKLWERYPQSHHPSNSATGSQVASGYSRVRGQVGDFFEETFRRVSSQPPTFVVQEFGTIAAPRVGHALIVENALQQHGNDASQWLRHAFYPDDLQWRRNVVTRGLRVLLQGMLP